MMKSCSNVLYLNYETVCTVLKMLGNVAAKEEVEEIYDNFKRMTSNALALRSKSAL